ncbi:hypothetical protein [Streptomyces griseiscabiei]|uniref:DUF4232 domain-containing protein n=1 Tax=Streptomyces griseiscabiei TaxID=2993540 RepID=A0ABU4L7K8_9ACTN|nr:hypothetical protein [Streptomyces griseiscabiei]MDX2911726.1 hypothetical protein [Streptomyces griseiscabiei]
MSTNGTNGKDDPGARRRASWGRRDEDEQDGHAGGRGSEEHEETPSHAGNGTVNHGPEEQGPHPKGQDLEGRAPDDLDADGEDGDDSPTSVLPASAPPADDPSTDGRSTDGARTDGAPEDAGDADDADAGPGPSDTAERPVFESLRLSALPSAGLNGSRSNGSRSDGSATGSDEPELRDLLQRAVSEIEPRDGTLEHLRRAVPARRARKRQAVVGMAAAALFIGTAIPALVHVSNSTGSDVNPSLLGNGSQTQESAGQSKGQTGAGGTSGGSSGGSKESGKDTGKGKGDKGKGESNGSTGGAQATPTTAASALCTAAQLGGGGSVGAPDSSGAVYGTFRVSNISGTSCTVTGAGGVSASPLGAADGSKISVLNHVAGDVAAGLPDPSLSLTQLMLAPGSAYEVQFAWVPSEPCPTTSGGTTDGGTGDPDPSPDPTPTGEETPGTTTDGSNSVSTQLFTEDGAVDGSVLVSHTAEGGVATFTTAVSNACAGVVYRTGLMTGV